MAIVNNVFGVVPGLERNIDSGFRRANRYGYVRSVDLGSTINTSRVRPIQITEDIWTQSTNYVFRIYIENLPSGLPFTRNVTVTRLDDDFNPTRNSIRFNHNLSLSNFFNLTRATSTPLNLIRPSDVGNIVYFSLTHNFGTQNVNIFDDFQDDPTALEQDNLSLSWDHVQEGGVHPIAKIYVGAETTPTWQQSNPPVITTFTANPTSADLDTATGNVTLSVVGTGFTNGKFINKSTGEVVQNFATTTGRATATTPIPTDNTTYTVVLTNATGATSQDLNFTVTKNPTIESFMVDHYVPGRQTHGITAVFSAVIDGRPQPALSANQGIGAITSRHLTRRSDGKWDLSYPHYFGTTGNRQVTLTATNSSGTVTATTTVTVP